jgi:hypothetical protein
MKPIIIPHILQADNVYMIGRCPRSYRQKDVAANCLRRDKNAPDADYSHLLDLPAWSTRTRRLYVNLYCAVCHGEDVGRDLVRWNMSIGCLTNVTGYGFSTRELMRDAEYIRGERRWTRYSG